MKKIVVGDVHGCLDELLKLLEMVEVDPSDEVIFLGDVVDRGPRVLDAVRFVRQGCLEGRFKCLLGNHEEKHVRWAKYEEERRTLGRKNPMRPFVGERAVQHERLTEEEREWLSELPPFVRFKDGDRDWIACHAGVPTDKPIEQQKVKTLVRTRWLDGVTGEYASTGDPNEIPEGAVYWDEKWAGPESVIHGHIVMDEPRFVEVSKGDAIVLGIDTGCCFGGKLTAAVFMGRGGCPMVLSVPAAWEYFPRRKTMDE